MKFIYFIPVFITVTWGIVSSIVITSFCSKKGIKINWFLWKIKIFQYVNDYKRITLEETGKPGFWYYSLTVSMGATLFLSALGLIFYKLNR